DVVIKTRNSSSSLSLIRDDIYLSQCYLRINIELGLSNIDDWEIGGCPWFF
ncbi:hypothetical protein KI387_018751, partial [Taxus chinensis]